MKQQVTKNSFVLKNMKCYRKQNGETHFSNRVEVAK